MVGESVGHYRILRKFSGARTGPFFVAEDMHSAQRVIIKILNLEPFRDIALKQRVIREIQAVAGLEHPHIVTCLGIEEAQEHTLIVFEMIEGESLSRRMTDGPVGELEVLNLALDVLDALDAAHQFGVLHCDLDPDSILIDGEGRAHLLGLGLGRMAGRFWEAGAKGAVPWYRAPESKDGDRCTESSDLFSLSVILYQWLTGTLPFSGADGQSYRESVLGEKPCPPSERIPGILSETDTLILTALEGDEKRRFRLSTEMRRNAEQAWRGHAAAISEGFPEEAGVELRPQPWWRNRLILAGAAALAIVLAFLGWQARQRSLVVDTRPRGVVLRQITSWEGVETDPSLSPDGRRVVFASDAGGNWNLWVGDLDSGNIVQLTRTPEAERYPSWSPDGSRVVYCLGGGAGGIYVIPAEGGERQELSPIGWRPSWSPTGTEIAFDAWTRVERSRIWLIPTEGGTATQVTQAENSREIHLHPRWSADGQELVYEHITEGKQNIWAVVIETRAQRLVTNAPIPDFDPAWDPVSKGTYFCSGVADSVNIFRTVPESRRRFKMTGEPGHYSGLSLSTDGRRMVFSSVEPRISLWRVRVSDGQTEWIETGLAKVIHPNISPDGRIVVSSDDAGSWDLYVLEAGKAVRMSEDRTDELHPRWSADGTCLAYISRHVNGSDIRVICPDGLGERNLTTEGENLDPRWSPDGRWVAYVKARERGRSDIWVADVAGGGAQVISRTGANTAPDWSPDGMRICFHSQGETWLGLYIVNAGGGILPRWAADGQAGAWSPDGRWIAYSEGRAGWEAVWALDVESAEKRRLTEGGGFTSPVWSPDGRYVAFISDRHGSPNLWIVPFEGGQARRVAEDANMEEPLVWSPDSEWLHFTKEASAAGDIWMYDNL